MYFPWGDYALQLVDNQQNTVDQLHRFEVNFFCATPNLIFCLPGATPWRPFRGVEYNKIIFNFSDEKVTLYAPEFGKGVLIVAEKVNLVYDELVLTVCEAFFTRRVNSEVNHVKK